MCQLIVTSCICEPVSETNCPTHIRRKSRWRSAANDVSRLDAGEELSGVPKRKNGPSKSEKIKSFRRWIIRAFCLKRIPPASQKRIYHRDTETRLIAMSLCL